MKTQGIPIAYSFHSGERRKVPPQIYTTIYVKSKYKIKFVGLVLLSAISPGVGVSKKLEDINFIYHEGKRTDPLVRIFNTIRKGNRLILNHTYDGIGHSVIHAEAKLLGITVNKLRKVYMKKITNAPSNTFTKDN